MESVRAGTPEDLEPLLPLYDALYRELKGFGLAFELEPDGLRSSLSTMLHSRRHLVAVAEADGKPAGFLTAGILRMDRKLSFHGQSMIGMIHDLYLIPEYRGAGLARRLLDRAEDWLAGQGASLVECQVVEGNSLGRAFWARQGYTPVSTTRSKVLPPKEEDAHVVSPG